MRKRNAVFATVSLAVAMIAIFSAPASADLVTRCVGTAGPVTVPGDLVVPADGSCTLEGTTVEGQVRVMTGADLVIIDGHLNGPVTVAPDAYLDATRTTIGDNVTSRGAYGVYLEDSHVSGAYLGRSGPSVKTPFLYAVEATVDGQINVQAGELYLDGTRVSGPVGGIGSEYTDVINSTLLSTLTVRDNPVEALICGSEVDGNAAISSSNSVQVGTGDLLTPCDVNYFGGDLTISANTGGVTVSGNIIRGDLAGRGNDPVPTGSNNRVRGEASGQFVDLAPTPEGGRDTSRSLASERDLSTDALQKSQDRRTAAVEAATAAGPADL